MIAFIATTSTAADLTQGTLERIKASGDIRLGYRENSVPFSYASKDGKPLGFSVELCRQIAAGIRESLKLQRLNETWVPLTATNRLNALKEGRVDIECGNTTNTPERRKSVAFVVPTFIAFATVISAAASPISDYNDMSGKRVTALRNGTIVNAINSRNENYAAGISLVEANDNSEALRWLEDGTVEAWAADDAILYGLRQTMKEPAKWTISAKRLSVEPLAFAVRLGDLEFEELVNKRIRSLMLSGAFSQEYQRWFLSTIPDRNINLNLPMSTHLRSFIAHPTSQMPVNY